ncbi:MAG TPA: alanine--tRNA ligase [Bacteroidaceae bacterium]|nr:alanine--tRNA ligase [Bacteroidaceae bacterium]
MMTAKEIRDSYKRFFESKGHTIVPSAPMVIKDDPTLMFTNAGMNQFKDIILGNRIPESRRVANSQKCLRVSGKHNDLEEVGHDTYHHTMFEMLGNWSFGDYFKKEAIEWAWEYLVEVLKIDPANLYATVFEGSPEEGLERDEEAAVIWEKFLPKDHILNGNKHDNFWEMGDTGPCGPCSEIHIDSRSKTEKDKIPGSELVNKDHPQVIEIWNLVFMQYNRKSDQSLQPLPAKVIDTGMGFERLVRTLQGKHSNYDTDVFQPIIKEISAITGKKYGEDEKTDIAMRVVSDHIRTIAFSIADGQLPSNAKAGYVIRRILRRAVRYAYTFLNRKEASLYKLIPVLIESMGEAYPELEAQKSLIEKVIIEEEESFLRTLDTGIKLLDKIISDAKATGKTQISGVDAFTLYDTYGFPLDLTELILRENGMTVNNGEFNSEMEKQKARARNAATVEKGDWIVLREGETKFVGYDFTEHEASILRYRPVKQKGGTIFQIVLDKTPFYAEMGGQTGDRGVLTNKAETVDVIDTKNENGLIVHIAKHLPNHPESPVIARVDMDKRRASEANHTATHLLDGALREVLGKHVEQKGSLVSPEGIRFDFSHFQKITDEELRRVERLVNEKIREDLPLQEYRELPIEEARKLGAIALFGEKYGDKVRVVQFGRSVEFCGGVHAASTGRIGMFKIISESSIAAGIRRIEARTGRAVEEMLYDFQDTISTLKNIFQGSSVEIAAKKAIEENSSLKKQIEELIREKAARIKDKLVEQAIEIEGIRVVSTVMPASVALVKDITFGIRAEYPKSTIIVIGSHENGKPMITVSVSDDLTSRFNAGQMVREAAKLIQGGGGGQPHFATAGGKNSEGLHAAVEAVKETVAVTPAS